MTGDELKALLGHMGLEIAGAWRTEEVLPPRAAWRRVTSGGFAPAVTVAGGRDAEVNAQWQRLAIEHGIVGEDGVFLLDVEGDGPGCDPRTWTRVRLGPGWDLTRAREFVTMAVGGDTVLGVTGDEDLVRITVVDRIAERLEAGARAAAEETPQERAAAWESLFEGLESSKRLRGQWADGLAGNPSAPDDLLVGLLGLSGHLLYRPLPTVVREAAIAHPEWNLRGKLAEVHPGITPDQWARLVLDEESPERRWALASLAAYRRAGLTDSAYERLAADPSARVREETAALPGLPVPLLTALAADADASVRAVACGHAWPHLNEPSRKRLLGDPDGRVRVTALLRHHQEHPMPRSVFDALEAQDRAVETCRLERGLAEELAHDDEPARRRALARNPHLDPDLALRLAHGDPDEQVRFQAALHPGLTEEERARIDFPFDPGLLHHELDWVVALHDDPAALRRLAASAHPLVRRSVARARRLPADVVERLARDEDRVVHLFLAESCDDAPAELLMSVWRWWTGSFSHPDRPHGHPNFPRRDLLRYADDPSPRMRRLALDDPDSTPELVERFSRDPGDEVRHRAASDARLSAASAVRLLDDPHAPVRHAAARHPRLPARVLTELLRDPETAQNAARHPALPVAVMRRMLHEVSTRGVG
jgi:hypothetical protein